MDENFPGKEPLSLQTDNFAERRSRAFDAYLQILLYAMRTLTANPRVIRCVKQFLNLPDRLSVKKEEPKHSAKKALMRTPNGLNSEIERLRQQLNVSDPPNSNTFAPDFKELQMQIHELQEKREMSDEDSRCVEKFYELKREWEIKKIRNGTFDGNEFSITASKNGKIVSESPEKETITSTSYSKSGSTPVLMLEDSKRNLYEQEAILSDLAVTLSKQKLLSKELCSELIEQNRLLGRVGEKQEIMAEEFKDSNDRVKKLQDK